MRARIALVAALAVASCGRDTLVGANANIHVAPSALAFGGVYLQAHAEQSLVIVNSGNGPDTISIALPDGAFSESGASHSIGPGGSLTLPITFAPITTGASAITMHVAWSDGSTDVALTGDGLAWPTCPTANGCETSQFNPQLGTCTLNALADGTACVSDDSCLTNTVCANGQCVGTSVSCDDGNACTLDACASGQGCIHEAITTCTGDDPCQVYGCDPSSGCTSTNAPDGTPCGTEDGCKTAGICVSGSCHEVNVPDGTPCKLPWAPCVSDATCESGACDSPTANAYTPGQILWKYDPDGGTDTWRSLEAVDGDGNSYAFDGNSSLFSLDTCGNVRWTQQLANYPYSALLAGNDLLVQQGGLLVARQASTGQAIWQVDLAQLFGYCDGGSACGDTLEGALFVNRPALSNQGQLFLSTESGDSWSNTTVAAIGMNGTVNWTKEYPLTPSRLYGESQVVDAHGDLYTFAENSYAPVLESFDSQGNMRFSVPAFSQTTVSVGPDFILDLGGQPSTAYSLTGTTDFALSSQLVQSPQFNSTGVIDAQGNTTFWPGAASTSTPGLLHIDDHGNPLASIIIQGFPMAELTLDEEGNTYVLGIGDPEHFNLWRWDGKSSALSLDVDLGPVFVGNQQRQNGYSLFVSHGMALLSLDEGVEAVFIGKHGEAKNAAWPRGYGGTNANTRSPNPGF